ERVGETDEVGGARCADQRRREVVAVAADVRAPRKGARVRERHCEGVEARVAAAVPASVRRVGGVSRGEVRRVRDAAAYAAPVLPGCDLLALLVTRAAELERRLGCQVRRAD